MDATALNLRATSSNFSSREAFLEARYRKAFETAAAGIGICDLQGRVIEGNPALARLLGCKQAELVGINPWNDSWKSAGGDSQLARTVGTGFSRAGEISELQGTGESLVLEKRLQRRDGSEFWGRFTASVTWDEGGQPAFQVLLLEDASGQRRMEENLRQSEKMAAIGQLAGGVAHDFNNLLTGILLYCDLLMAELQEGGTAYRYVEEIRRASEQGAAMTRQLLALARKEGLEAEAMDINKVAAGMENLLRRLIGEQIELIAALDPAAGTVVGEAVQLRQILLNLVLNARDAVSRGATPGGKVRVSTRLADWPRGCRKNGSAGANDPSTAVVLTVEDNGCGMSAGTRAHLFEPFFTTKEAGAGSGIGLGTVRRIVEELGGAIEVVSEPGSGTRVEVFLPMAEDGEERRGDGARARDPEIRDFANHVPTSKVKESEGSSPC